jgi:hypothetical protein
MNSKYLLLIFQIFCLLGMAAGIITSVQASESKDGSQDPLVAAKTDVINITSDSGSSISLVDEATQEKADSLSGTCPKGFHCSCQNCPLYSDLDKDSFCDLGEETDN